MSPARIDPEIIAAGNAALRPALEDDRAALDRRLQRRGIDPASLAAAVASFEVAVPSWGVGTGGTRFARFPGPGEPRSVLEKLDDCAVIQELVRCTPRVSTHFPWDAMPDMVEVREHGAALGLGFDAVNSNSFQDQPGQALSYKHGSLAHTDEAVRAQAIAHNQDCIAKGRALGATALTVWIADGANFPGQQSQARAFDRYLSSMEAIHDALPPDWLLFLEHKLYEPAFYSTVIADWGSSYMAAVAVGARARCLVDLGHHAPTVNIEQIVARLAAAGRLGGFHFNDSRYGDDDLDSGAIDPFRLFLVFHELAEAAATHGPSFRPAFMMDQSHNVTDPIESLIASAVALQRAFAQAQLVDRAALHAAQEANDVMMARRTLTEGFETDVAPLLATVRAEAGGAIDPIAAYRASRYRERVTALRPQAAKLGGGIV